MKLQYAPVIHIIKPEAYWEYLVANRTIDFPLQKKWDKSSTWFSDLFGNLSYYSKDSELTESKSTISYLDKPLTSALLLFLSLASSTILSSLGLE